MADIYFRPDGQNRFQIRSAANGTLPSAWLDQEYNRIYTYLNTIEGGGATTGSEWAEVNAEGTQVSTTSFTVEGDYSNVFEDLRAIEITDDSDVKANSHIKSSTYVAGTNTTTVVLYDAIVPETIKAISVGLISSEAQPIPSFNYTTRSSAYTVGASDQIILVNDSTIGNLTLVYDDGQVNGNGYYALLITLPVAGDMPGKLLCVKKIAGTYQTIVSSSFTHTTSTVGTDTVHTNTYTFQVYGDTEAKNRVTLKGIGDCYWFFSNGSRWYELTPEASETVKGIVRFATDAEMTLTAEQIADGESLSKNVAVSPYQADKEYLRTDASNMRFASNYIYKAPNGVAELVNNNIIVYNGLGLNFPNGRDSDGVIQSTKRELAQNYTFNPIEVTSSRKYLLIRYDSETESFSLQSVLAKNYSMAYDAPGPSGTTTGEEIIWFDLKNNILKESTDNGTNWTRFNGAGPICCYWGNGTYITDIYPLAAVSFVTKEDYELFLRQKQYRNSTGGLTGNSGYERIGIGGAFWQWGQSDVTSSFDNIVTINFPSPFADTSYSISLTSLNAAQRDKMEIHIMAKATTYCQAAVSRIENTATGARLIEWQAVGWASY